MTEAAPNSTTATTAQRSILFVDDNVEYLQMIERLLRLWSNNNLEIYCAHSASAALAALQQHQPDLIVMDVCMPVVDGLQLLGMLNRRCPGTPKVVLTSNADDSYRTACLNNGAEFFLEKPRNSEGFEAVFSTLDELTRWKPEPGFRGVLRSVGLTDIIQMECIARSSSVLAVTSKELTGAIYIRDGSIIHAQAGQSVGEEAFKRLIALVSGDFRSQPFVEPPEETIQMPWESLLMDAAQARDELLGAESEKVAVEPVPEPEPEPAPPAEESHPPIDIDELVICSEAGDVYHAWQCDNTELRINLLEFLTRKARAVQVALPSGSLDRAEFIASGSRLVAQISLDRGVIVRSSLSGIATPKNDPMVGSSRGKLKAQLRQKVEQWFGDQIELAGLFTATLLFPNRTGPTHSRAPQFTEEGIELMRRTANEGFQVLKLQRFHAQRARWLFENLAMETAQWPDGTLLALVFNRRALEMNAAIVEQQVNAFVNFDRAS
jgi:CheY-like chemotaxis protein